MSSVAQGGGFDGSAIWMHDVVSLSSALLRPAPNGT